MPILPCDNVCAVCGTGPDWDPPHLAVRIATKVCSHETISMVQNKGMAVNNYFTRPGINELGICDETQRKLHLTSNDLIRVHG